MGAPKGNKYAVGNKGGQKPTYETPEEMESIIDEYFESCWDEYWKDTGKRNEQGKNIWEPVYDKDGNIQMILRERPTVTGLALALGFNSRQTLMNYEVKKDFMDTIKKAKLLIESYYEKGVVEGDIHPATGIFILKNFEWKDTFDINTNKEPETLDKDNIQERLKEIKRQQKEDEDIEAKIIEESLQE